MRSVYDDSAPCPWDIYFTNEGSGVVAMCNGPDSPMAGQKGNCGYRRLHSGSSWHQLSLLSSDVLAYMIEHYEHAAAHPPPIKT